MTSRSDLSILRVYLPAELIDELHALAHEHDLPVRRVVRGILELGLPLYIARWRTGAAPVYQDDLSDRPYQGARPERRQDEPLSIEQWKQYILEDAMDALGYDEQTGTDGRS